MDINNDFYGRLNKLRKVWNNELQESGIVDVYVFCNTSVR
jgi:hypothetical protein